MKGRDAIVVGAGHNGITCACDPAKAGPSVLVLEQYGRIEGLTRSEELAQRARWIRRASGEVSRRSAWESAIRPIVGEAAPVGSPR